AEVQARALGVESTGVFVAHPIQDRSDEEMKALAEEAFSRICQALVG
ncbi:MAG: UGSC family (seleno)protein, partial [Candidatus Binatia bacterium]|nr:UGSC family (seleno)protein [Candidatus Binatia bacterium]